MEEPIYVITNRACRKDSDKGGYILRDVVNPKGPKELRILRASPKDQGRLDRWDFQLIPDKPKKGDFQGLDMCFIRKRRRFAGSDLAAAELVKRLRERRRNLVIFVHGYNNTVEDALRRAWGIRKQYGVEVVVFTWPANGGGDNFIEDLHGTASYISDKSDARSSTGALDRALSRMQGIVSDLNATVFDEARSAAETESPNNREEQRRSMSRYLRANSCPFNVTLLAHSMGNYLLKKTIQSSGERLSRGTFFDNVILKAADTNHDDHKSWVEEIKVRRRVYILINQDDNALKLSTLKVGEAQQPRLGNTLAEQTATNATYLDVTGSIGDEHSYFCKTDVETAPSRLWEFFEQSLNGRSAGDDLDYQVDTNTYRV